ncbi:MAG TPA: diacylglycerol kinase family protein [Gaiellaceae bacterium]|nr:diacylglycerol kinase family protein [Gaiellaceae bacterium]
MQESSPDGWGPAAPPEQPTLFVNPKSGNGTAERVALAERARERGIEVVVLGAGGRLAALVDEAVRRGADVLGMAGGDGSMAVVATASHAHDLPFVCVPAGTRNHFALDLGLDADDPVGALDAFTDGAERTIDLGRVNDRVFLNNVSLGIYGEAVRHPTYRDAKVRTLVETTREVLDGTEAAPELEVVDDVGREHRRPPLVLVSNNPYALDSPAAHGARPTLDSGLLGVILLAEPGTTPAPLRAWSATSLTVDAPGTVHAGIDGEAVDLSPPLELRIVPRGLRARIPARRARELRRQASAERPRPPQDG